MNKSIASALAISLGLSFSNAATAESLSQADYKAARDVIATEYKTDRAACASMPADAQRQCHTDAKSKQKAARAELAARQKPESKPVAKKESTGEYIDDAVITTKVKAAVLEEASLKSAEINVETYKGIVQLSGFVRSRANISKAVEVARRVRGVKSVRNDMIVKGQQ